MRKELLEGLTAEQIKKIDKCKDPKEILELAKKEGVTLTDEQLEAVSGGCGVSDSFKCPKCGAKTKDYYVEETNVESYLHCECHKCGYKWIED